MSLWLMNVYSVVQKIFFIAFVLLFLVSTSSATEYSPEKLTWNNLKYSGSKFFMSLDTSVNVELINDAQTAEELITTPEGKGKMPASKQIVKVNVKNSVIGSDTDFTVWVEPDTTVLQRTSVYGGIKEWYRTYRFMNDRVYSDKRKPANSSEEGKHWSTWAEGPSYYPLDKIEQGVVVSESEALFYLIGVAGLEKKDDQVTLNVYDRSGVIAATVKVVGTKKVLVDYLVKQGNKSSRVNKKITALELVLEAKPIKDDGDLEDFKFLGYKDDIRMLINPELNTILQISGSIEYVGEVTIRLEEISLKPKLLKNQK